MIISWYKAITYSRISLHALPYNVCATVLIPVFILFQYQSIWGIKKHIYEYMTAHNTAAVFITRYHCLVRCSSVGMNDLELEEQES